MESIPNQNLTGSCGVIIIGIFSCYKLRMLQKMSMDDIEYEAAAPSSAASNPAAAATQTATPIRVARRVYFLQSPSASTKECILLGRCALEF